VRLVTVVTSGLSLSEDGTAETVSGDVRDKRLPLSEDGTAETAENAEGIGLASG
jgi:hypothetical protein